MTEESPSEKPAVMRGCPLEAAEKAAVQRAVREADESVRNGAAATTHDNGGSGSAPIPAGEEHSSTP